MKKILLSVLTIALTIGIVSSSAYALFSDTVQVSGITLSTGNADLKIQDQDSWSTPITLSGLFPGFGLNNSKFFTFKLSNNSLSDISLGVTAKLTTANDAPGKGGSWEALKNVIQVNVIDVATGAPTGWMTLAQWNSQARSFPGPVLAKSEYRSYNVYLMVPSSATNTIAGKQLNDVTFELVGTQQ